MAVAAKKAVAVPAAVKKSAVRKPKVQKELSFTAVFKKSTDNTHQYTEEAERGSQISGGIYVQKRVLGDETPQRVRVTITVID